IAGGLLDRLALALVERGLKVARLGGELLLAFGVGLLADAVDRGAPAGREARDLAVRGPAERRPRDAEIEPFPAERGEHQADDQEPQVNRHPIFATPAFGSHRVPPLARYYAGC